MTALFSFDAKRVCEEFLSAEQYRSCCAVLWSADRRAGLARHEGAIPPGARVYAKTDHYLPLFHRLRRNLSRVVLVTAESDVAVTDEIHALAPAQVGAWFSTNAEAAGVRALPLGLGNSYCPVTPKAPTLAEFQTEPGLRKKWLYVNFRSATNPVVRQPVIEHFRSVSGSWLTVREGGVSPGEFLTEMTDHRFVLCPPGNGWDTHRMWEALYCKTIPVVQRHRVFQEWEDLPILFVNDLRAVTLEFLERSYAEMREACWNQEKMFLPWWRSVLEASAAALHPKRLSPASLVAGALARRLANLVAGRRRPIS